MGIKHTTTKATGNKIFAADWNIDHHITTQVNWNAQNLVNVAKLAVGYAAPPVAAGDVAIFNGNIGIGTTSPNAKLDIHGTGSQNLLNITDGSTDAMFIDSSGRVGIGTTSPSAKLDVNGSSIIQGDLNVTGTAYLNNVNISGVTISEGDLNVSGNLAVSGTSKFGGTINTNNNWISGDGGAEGIYVADDGMVGIGTNKLSSVFEKLTVKYTNTSKSYLKAFLDSNSINLIINKNAVNKGGQIQWQTNEAPVWYNGVADSDDAGSGNEYFIGQSSGGANADLWIETSGNIGIGTTSPNAKIDVKGSGADIVNLRNASNEVLTVLNNGNVGIGTTSPNTKLDVNSDKIRLRTAKTPASAGAAGNAGDICWDANYIYVCVATNTWKRVAITTW